jgi:cysteine desulfurase/selenocysteine lyase
LGSLDPLRHHGIVSFTITGCTPNQAASTLETRAEIMVRAGRHFNERLRPEEIERPEGSIRISLAPFNTREEVSLCLKTLETVGTLHG